MNVSRRILHIAQSPKEYMAFLILLVVFVISIFIKNEFVLHLAILSFLYAGLGSAWNILGGMTGQFSLGHAAFFGLGAYISTFLYLSYGISPWVGMVIGGIVSSIIGVIIFYPSFRLREFYFVIATIAFLELVRSGVTFWRITEGGIDTFIPFEPHLKNMIFESKNAYAILMFFYLILLIIVGSLIKNSKMGYYIRAVGENNEAAEMVGVSSSRNKLYALILSSFLTAVGGTLYVQYFLFVTPTMVFSMILTVQFALFAIIGGIGTLAGPVIGSFILTILDTFFRAWLGGTFGAIGSLIYGVMLVVIVTFLPSGILPWIESRMEPIWKRLPKARKSLRLEEYKFSMEPEVRAVRDYERHHIILEVEKLTKNFRGLTAVANLNFKVLQNEILGLIGPNGSGKTTTFNLLSGFLRPSRGRIIFQGEDITHLNSPNRICRKGIGRTFQIVKPFGGMTVHENVMVGSLLNRTVSDAEFHSLNMIKSVGLWDFKFEYANNLPIPLLKRLELAKAISSNPKFLLLDECMAGLNSTEKAELIKVLKEIQVGYGITMMIIEHDMKSIMSLSDRIMVLNYGEKIAEGTPEEISRNPEVISAYLGQEGSSNAAN